jgi:hypothetical protein
MSSLRDVEWVHVDTRIAFRCSSAWKIGRLMSDAEAIMICGCVLGVN